MPSPSDNRDRVIPGAPLATRGSTEDGKGVTLADGTPLSDQQPSQAKGTAERPGSLSSTKGSDDRDKTAKDAVTKVLVPLGVMPLTLTAVVGKLADVVQKTWIQVAGVAAWIMVGANATKAYYLNRDKKEHGAHYDRAVDFALRHDGQGKLTDDQRSVLQHGVNYLEAASRSRAFSSQLKGRTPFLLRESLINPAHWGVTLAATLKNHLAEVARAGWNATIGAIPSALTHIWQQGLAWRTSDKAVNRLDDLLGATKRLINATEGKVIAASKTAEAEYYKPLGAALEHRRRALQTQSDTTGNDRTWAKINLGLAAVLLAGAVLAVSAIVSPIVSMGVGIAFFAYFTGMGVRNLFSAREAGKRALDDREQAAEFSQDLSKGDAVANATMKAGRNPYFASMQLLEQLSKELRSPADSAPLLAHLTRDLGLSEADIRIVAMAYGDARDRGDTGVREQTVRVFCSMLRDPNFTPAKVTDPLAKIYETHMREIARLLERPSLGPDSQRSVKEHFISGVRDVTIERATALFFEGMSRCGYSLPPRPGGWDREIAVVGRYFGDARRNTLTPLQQDELMGHLAGLRDSLNAAVGQTVDPRNESTFYLSLMLNHALPPRPGPQQPMLSGRERFAELAPNNGVTTPSTGIPSPSNLSPMNRQEGLRF